MELVEELAFLVNYDRTKKSIQEIVDMPDRQIDLNHIPLSVAPRRQICFDSVVAAEQTRDCHLAAEEDEPLMSLEGHLLGGMPSANLARNICVPFSKPRGTLRITPI